MNSFEKNHQSCNSSGSIYKTKLYSTLNNEPIDKIEDQAFPKDLENKIFCSSSEDMFHLPNNSIHLIITSPPYNVSKEYDEDLSLKEYLQFLGSVFKECYRVLVDGGRICINLANVGRKPYIPLTDYVSNLMIDIGFLMRGEIIWNKAASVGGSTAWGSWKSASNPTLRDVHEYVLIFTKGGYKRCLTDSEKVMKSNSISSDEFVEWTKSIWNISTESAKKVKHPAPFPVELPYRLIQLYSFSNDIVLDPFIGSGTTAIASVKSNRIFVGYEINETYVKNAWSRIKPHLNTFSF